VHLRLNKLRGKKSVKLRLSSGNTIPIVMLVVLPIVFMLSYSGLFDSIFMLIPYEANDGLSQYVGPFVRIGVIFIIFGIYIPYPLTYYTERFFKKRGHRDSVMEYDTIKKILYFSIPLPVAFVIITLFFQYQYQYSVDPAYDYYHSQSLEPLIVFADLSNESRGLVPILNTTVLIIIISGLTRLLIYLARRDFRYMYAKSCFLITANESIDEMQKMKYLLKGLNSYNIYLRRHLHMRTDVNKILLKIGFTAEGKKESILKSLHNCFEEDRLGPLKYISSLLDIPPTEELLAKEKLGERLKEWITLVAIIIPILISINQLLTPIWTLMHPK
jgi:hypothetical protein